MVSVGVAVVTYNRAETVVNTLERVLGQEPSPEYVVVVDNASTDGTHERVRARFGAAVDVRTQPDNLGAAAGRGVGMGLVVDREHDWCWLVDDDSPPGPGALALLLEVATSDAQVGIVGVSGGVVRRGAIRHVRASSAIKALPSLDQGRLCDFVLLDGALVRAEAIRRAGRPRDDYFIMMEDIEYSLRLGRTGYRVVLRPDVPVELKHMGSTGPWRCYYQTRNELLMARDLHRPVGYVGWVIRQGKFVVGHVISSDRKWERIRYRALGAWHGINGVRGRTVEPRA